MKLYLVRHGQTNSNRENIHQFPNTPLSKLGESQARFVGKRFDSIKIEKLIASPYKRAHQTAREIEANTAKEILISDLFIERKNPTEWSGKHHDDPELMSTKALIEKNMGDPKWHYKDEENFYDLLLRADKALSFIIDQKVENIAVVTHGYFLGILTCRIMFGDTLNAPVFQSFRKHSRYSNTGISMFEYNDDKWTALTWNDHAHLGE